MSLLASVITIVVYAQLTGRRSMLSAMLKGEYLQLAQDQTARQTGGARGESWADVTQAFASMQRGNAVAGRHEAVFKLLRLLQPFGAKLNSSDLVTAKSYLQADSTNLTSRMALAVIELTVRSSISDPDVSVLDRFEAAKSEIEGERPAEVATLYNGDLVRLAHRAIKSYVSRPDVALSLAESGRLGVPSPGHYGAFATIQERMTELADELRVAGHEGQANRCQRWIAQWLLGVMDSEPDASTRLLCADLLARSIREEHAPVARDLRRMRSDFHRQALAAPLDYADQAPYPLPSLAPTEYRRAVRWLVASWCLTLSALGGFMVFGLACIVSIGARALNRRRPDTAREKNRLVLRAVVGALIPSSVACALTLICVFDAELPSMDWGVTAAAVLVTTGALSAIALAGISIVSTDENRRRRWVPVLLATVAGLSLLTPPVWITKACRFLDASIGAPVVIGIIFAIILVVTAWMSPARARTVAAFAAAFWCVNISAAFVVNQIHRAADRRYQAAVVDARADEMGARLGPDWQEVYLASARRTLRDEFR